MVVMEKSKSTEKNRHVQPSYIEKITRLAKLDQCSVFPVHAAVSFSFTVPIEGLN